MELVEIKNLFYHPEHNPDVVGIEYHPEDHKTLTLYYRENYHIYKVVGSYTDVMGDKDVLFIAEGPQVLTPEQIASLVVSGKLCKH